MPVKSSSLALGLGYSHASLTAHPFGVVRMRRKLTVKQLEQVTTKESGYHVYGLRVSEIEICGVIVEEAPRTVTICDFSDKFDIFKPTELKSVSGSALLTIKPFKRGSKISFFCNSIRKATLYEEIFFGLEVHALVQQGFYKPEPI